MKLHVLNGFLGSGKTTAIQMACLELSKKNINSCVITNDQGMKLVDSFFFRKQNIPLRQVVNGCFCCNYSELEESIESLIETNNPDVIFAETVGSCADIVATVIKPLLLHRPDTEITFSVFADVRFLYLILLKGTMLFEENISYIFFKQLEEAQVIIINKTDMLEAEKLNELSETLKKKYNDKILLYQNSLNEDSVGQWLKTLDKYQNPKAFKSLQIDYNIYGAGEASLVWLDEEVEIYSAGNNALNETVGLINNIYKKIQSKNYPIGHLKFILNDETKISFTSLNNAEIRIDNELQKLSNCNLLINARIQTDPETLLALISEAIQQAEKKSGVKVITKTVSAFQPGFPKPEYRFAD